LNSSQGELINSSKGLQTRLPGTEPFSGVQLGTYKDSSTAYLYTVDERGLNIALEQTSVGSNSIIKHTNLSSQASIGGEVWFGPNNTVMVNAFSGRFGVGAGVTDTQWQNTIKLWESLGYKVKAIPFR